LLVIAAVTVKRVPGLTAVGGNWNITVVLPHAGIVPLPLFTAAGSGVTAPTEVLPYLSVAVPRQTFDTAAPPLFVTVTTPTIAFVAGSLYRLVMLPDRYAGPAIASVVVDDVPPPGAGLVTETSPDPDDATALAGTAAVNSVAETYVVASGEPLQRTVEPATNPVPPMVSVKAGAPGTTRDGLMLLIVGAGLCTIAKLAGFVAFVVDVPATPATLTLAVPADTNSDGGTGTWMVVGVTEVGVSVVVLPPEVQ